MSIRDDVIGQAANSCVQLLSHAARAQRGRPPLPEIDSAGHHAALEAAERTAGTAAERKQIVAAAQPPPIGPRIFDGIEGHDDAKRVLLAALKAREPTHVLLVGPPGSGKTQLLQAIARLPQSRYATGPTISRSGIFSYLYEHPEVKRLVIDELDKADEPDRYVLLTLMESGKITRLQHGATEEAERKVSVLAAANDDRELPEALRARFIRVQFRAYTREEARRILERVLERREGLPPARARAIARAVSARSTDPRDGLQVAALTEHGESLEWAVEQVTAQQTAAR
jgi:Holliday junction DNA helicase RuvB